MMKMTKTIMMGIHDDGGADGKLALVIGILVAAAVASVLVVVVLVVSRRLVLVVVVVVVVVAVLVVVAVAGCKGLWRWWAVSDGSGGGPYGL